MTELAIGIFSIVNIILIFVNYRIALYMLILLMPFNHLLPTTPVPGINAETLIIVPIFILSIVNNRESNVLGRPYSLNKPIIWLIGACLLACFTPLLFGSGAGFPEDESFFTIKRMVTYMFLYYIFVLNSKSPADLRIILTFLEIGVSIEAFHVFKDFVVSGRSRVYGSLGNPNELGAFLAAYGILPFMLFTMSRDRMQKIFFLLSTFLSLFCIVQTQSRGGYLAFTAAVLIYTKFKSTRCFIITCAAVTIIVFNYSSILPDVVVNRINESFAETDDYDTDTTLEDRLQSESAGSRVKFWKSGIKMIGDSFIFGMGYNLFAYYLPAYGGEFGITKQRPAHNMYITIFAELGIIGMIPFLWIFISSYRSAGRLRRLNDDVLCEKLSISLACAAGAFMVAMIFGDRFERGSLVSYFWILAALVYRANYMFTDKNESISSSTQDSAEISPAQSRRAFQLHH